MTMNNHYRFFLILISCLTFGFSGFAQSYPIVTENGQRYYEYTVLPSEGLFAVSKKFGVSQSDILKVNPGVNELKVGQKIKVPVLESEHIHTVAKGETLFSLAKTYKTTVDDLVRLNPQAKDGIKSGQKLKIITNNAAPPIVATRATTSASATAPVATASKSQVVSNDTIRNHTIVSGETLYSLAGKYKTTVDEIIRLNPEVAKGLKVGQVIKVPTRKRSDVPKDQTNRMHTVASGETLYSLANSYNTSVDEIIRLNPDVSGGLKTGSSIIIPREKDGYIYHTIQDKETLFSVSKWYDLTQEEVLATNPGLSASNFVIGKVVRLDADLVRKKKAERAELELMANSSFEYILEQKEQVEDIAKKFNVSVEDIKRLNPNLKKKLSKGDKILIPAPKMNLSAPTQTTSEALNLKNTTAQIAIMLPFMTNVADKKAERERMVEYYEGFLMALNEVKQKGFSGEVFVYDLQNADAIKQTLAKPELKKMNLIIGPAYDENVDMISDFSKANHIPLVIPFTSKNNSYQTNPYIYQVNSPQSFFYSKVGTTFIKEFKDYNIIILSSQNVADEKLDFTNSLAAQLRQNGIAHQMVKIAGTNANALDAALSSVKKNVIIPTFSSSSALDKTMPAILKVKQNNSSKNVVLFGYPEWQTYNKTTRSRFMHPMDTYIFSPFYASLSSMATTAFKTNYTKTYGKEILPTFPKFALLGYDTGKYFLTALQRSGYTFHKESTSYYTGLQTNFNFERVNYWSGYINKNVCFIHFDSNNNVNAVNYK